MLNDPRIGEMKFILKGLQCWHKYNAEVNVGEANTAEQRRAWGLSHQLLFDTECMVEGFIGLVDFICELWMGAAAASMLGRSRRCHCSHSK